MGLKPVFQIAQEVCFDTNLSLYGQDATWKAIGKQDSTEIVLFNDPTKAQRMQLVNGRGFSHVTYGENEIIRPYIEYRKGQFDGLFETVMDNQDILQYIETEGVLYVCQQAMAFFDGQTYRIHLHQADVPFSN